MTMSFLLCFVCDCTHYFMPLLGTVKFMCLVSQPDYIMCNVSIYRFSFFCLFVFTFQIFTNICKYKNVNNIIYTHIGTSTYTDPPKLDELSLLECSKAILGVSFRN